MVVVVEEGDRCTVIARMVRRKEEGERGLPKNVVLIPTHPLKVLLIPPFLRYMPTDHGVRRSSSSHRANGAGIMPPYCTDIYHSCMGTISMHQNEF